MTRERDGKRRYHEQRQGTLHAVKLQKVDIVERHQTMGILASMNIGTVGVLISLFITAEITATTSE